MHYEMAICDKSLNYNNLTAVFVFLFFFYIFACLSADKKSQNLLIARLLNVNESRVLNTNFN